MDYNLYAKKILDLKMKEVNQKFEENLTKELNKIFNKRYNAICIDIDGVLVDENLEYKDGIFVIGNFLKKHIPIVLVTGRGESSTRKYVKDISKELYSQYGVLIENLKHISCICNNGTILMYTDPNNTNKLLTNIELLVPNNNIEKISNLYTMIRNDVYKEFPTNLIVDRSYCNSLNCITGIRFIMENNKIKEKLWRYLNKYICKEGKFNPEGIFKLTEGEYNNKNVFQIGVADNENSILEAERLLGIPNNSMIRIFDQGDEKGNDYKILKSKQGFSTGTISKDPFSCFPIIDEHGNVLKGINATKYILNSLKITPSICLENIDKKRYSKLLAITEQKIVLGRNEVIKKTDEILNKNFGVLNGFSDIFDIETGAVKFNDYEWYILDENNLLKNIFDTRENNRRKYSIEDDNSILLRGADTYYYILANKNTNNIKKLSTDNLIEWKNNYIDFINISMNAIVNLNNKTDYLNRRLQLAYVDNIRNLSLIMLYANMYNKYKENNIHLSFNNYKDDSIINSWYKIVGNITDLMDDICFESKEYDYTERILNVSERINCVLESNMEKILQNPHVEYEKCFKAFREIDNFAENRITMDLVLEKIKRSNCFLKKQDVSFTGIAYGGLELPFIAKKILKNNEKSITINAVMLKGNYKDRHKELMEKFENDKIKVIGNVGSSKSYNVVMDDNVLTGRTLQMALNGLFNNGFKVNDLAIVRYPSLNRLEQMCQKGHGAVDVTQFFTYIKGLLFPSPYSKILSYKEFSYKDEFGVFNKTREKILKCLYKNGKYQKDSEVDKRFSYLER